MKRYYFILLGVFIVMDLYLMYSLVAIKDKYEEDKIINIESSTKTVGQIFDNSYSFSNYKLDDFIKIVTSQINLESPTLLFTYSYNECNDCILSDLSILRESKAIYEKLNVLVIPIGVSSRNDLIMMKSDLHDLSYENILNDKIVFPVCKGHDSRFYGVYFNGELKMPFIPDKNNKLLTHSYIEYIYQKYFQ